jgi:site-specific DNA-methyltransferase (cytosine-N4-specific)
VFVTDRGVMLWGDAHDASALIADGTVDLFMSSLPYPDQQKPYENQHPERAHVDWVLGLAERIRPKLHDDGSMVLNLGAPFERGRPAESTWIHRLVLRMVDELDLVLCQTLYWHNPAKLPSPAEWVCIRRERLVPDVEPVLWFAKHPHPYADNSGVLRPYSRAMVSRLASGGETGGRRPSGHALARGAFGADNGGAIAGTLLSAANTDSNSYYFRRCRETGIPTHPARFPAELPERAIGFLTPPGGLVADLCCGSGKTAAAAERLGRRWIACDLSLTYVRGSVFHFERLPDFRTHLPLGLRAPAPGQADLFAAPQGVNR